MSSISSILINLVSWYMYMKETEEKPKRDQKLISPYNSNTFSRRLSKHKFKCQRKYKDKHAWTSWTQAQGMRIVHFLAPGLCLNLHVLHVWILLTQKQAQTQASEVWLVRQPVLTIKEMYSGQWGEFLLNLWSQSILINAEFTCREQEEDRLFDAMIEAKGLFRCVLSIYILLTYINQY